MIIALSKERRELCLAIQMWCLRHVSACFSMLSIACISWFDSFVDFDRNMAMSCLFEPC